MRFRDVRPLQSGQSVRLQGRPGIHPVAAESDAEGVLIARQGFHDFVLTLFCQSDMKPIFHYQGDYNEYETDNRQCCLFWGNNFNLRRFLLCQRWNMKVKALP